METSNKTPEDCGATSDREISHSSRPSTKSQSSDSSGADLRWDDVKIAFRYLQLCDGLPKSFGAVLANGDRDTMAKLVASVVLLRTWRVFMRHFRLLQSPETCRTNAASFLRDSWSVHIVRTVHNAVGKAAAHWPPPSPISQLLHPPPTNPQFCCAITG